MKKGFLFLLIFVLMFALASCGKDDEDGDDNTVTYDQLEMSKSESQAKVNELSQTGFEFDSVVKTGEETSNYTFGSTADYFWFYEGTGEDRHGTAIYHADGMYHMYSYSEGEWEFSASVSDAQVNLADSYKTLFNTWAFWCYSDSLQGFQKQGEVSVAGRSCTKYSLNAAGISTVGTYNFSYDVCVDKATGITMKVAFTGQAGLESAAVSYEVTRFITGGAVIAPKLPAPTDPSVD